MSAKVVLLLHTDISQVRGPKYEAENCEEIAETSVILRKNKEYSKRILQIPNHALASNKMIRRK